MLTAALRPRPWWLGLVCLGIVNRWKIEAWQYPPRVTFMRHFDHLQPPVLLRAVNGEERLLAGIERGVIPTSVAMEIARAKDGDIQEALAEAYENKSIPGNQILAIRRIIELRNVHGKGMAGPTSRLRPQTKKRVTADSLVRAYRKETERQKLLVKKATVSQSRLLFVVNALRRLLSDEHFVTLLRAEALLTLPRPLAERIGVARG